jgi:hypothetical protein
MNIKDPEDCVFVVNEDKESLVTYCLTCYQEKLKNTGGMFWSGSQRGYGPWKINCDFCNKIINEGSDADK